MREYSFEIDAALTNGLRRDPRVPPNSAFMAYMKNAKPTEFKAVSPEPVAYPIEDDLPLELAWPFPQLFRGKSVTLLCFQDTIYEVDESDWTVTEINTKDYYSPSEDKAITEGGGPWHFMDFWGEWMLFNGVCQLVHSLANDTTYVQDTVTIKTGCDFFEGRAIFAGFDPDDFYSSDWQSFLTGYLNDIPAEVQSLIDVSAGADANWVWWSTIGGGDMHWLFSKDFMIYGCASLSDQFGYGPEKPYVLELWKRNEAGLRPMPWRGEILCVKPLGKTVIVYGKNGVTALIPQGKFMGSMDIAGLGKDIGIESRCAVAGDYTGHMFIDRSGELWTIEPNLQATRLGYSEYLSPMLSNEIMGSFDPVERDYWFTDGEKCYVYSRTGLGGPMDTMPTSVARSEDGDLIGPAILPTIDDGEADPPTVASEMELRTCHFDLNERGTKHVTTVQITSFGLTQMKTRIHYKYSGDTYKASTYTPLNPNGVGFPVTSFVDGKVSVKGKVGTGQGGIQRIEVRYNGEDKRFVRGTKGIPKEA